MSDWPKNVDRPPWRVSDEAIDEMRKCVVTSDDDKPAPVVQVVSNTELLVKFGALKAAVKMAVRHYDQVGTDAIEGVLEGLKDALEEAEK